MKTAYDERIKVLLYGLKAGDLVAVTNYSWSGMNNKSMTVQPIKKVLPSGRIRLENGKLFDKTGREVGVDHHAEFLDTMEEYNAWENARQEKAAKRRMISKIEEKINEMSIDQLAKMVEIMEA
jgi:hypothetical protein